MILRILPALLISCIVTPAAGADTGSKISRKALRLLAMTPDEFAAKMVIRDDALEVAAEISTVNGWQQKDGLLSVVNSDQFFRAFVDKKSGVTTFQVYQFIHYFGQWAFFTLVNFESLDGPVQRDLTVVNRVPLGCSHHLGCEHVEHVAFDVDEALLRAAAAAYRPGAKQAWHYRLKAKSGVQRDEGFVGAEIVALLAAVDKYRAAKGFKDVK
jgi:hypothetical protein